MPKVWCKFNQKFSVFIGDKILNFDLKTAVTFEIAVPKLFVLD